LDEQKLKWLPDTCAYKLLSEGQSLKNWHPLLSGRQESVHEAGISMSQMCISENDVHEDDFIRHVIQWKSIS
jgi:uncharacterized cysteine cluster protein YcgN (CxxCxxCC family)